MMEPGAYCREIETYLCRRNGGHLIRIVGPAFERVCGWAEAGVPLQVVVEGIDRKLARYQALSGRRRPLRIEHCEADILQTFDEWRRAVGVSDVSDGAVSADRAYAVGRSGHYRVSLPKHIDRVLTQTTNRLALAEPIPGVHAALEGVVDQLERLRRSAGSARGTAREALLNRLVEIDRELLADARVAGAAMIADLEGEARAELAPFRTRLDPESYVAALAACIDRLVRDRFRLPIVRFND